MTINKRNYPGIDLDQIPSPCFVLEEELLIKNLRLLQSVSQRSGAKILCALKGFSMWSVFPLVQEYLEGGTASSLNEARLIYEEMGTKSHTCCPVYLEDEFEEIKSISSHITFNSIHQFERFKDRVIDSGIELAIRINPEYSEVGTALYNPCMPGSRLGVTAEQFGDNLPDGITGLHFHALCEQNADSLVNVLRNVEEKFGAFLPQLKWINFGGGHHITRADYDIDLLVDTLINFKKKYNLEVFLEPGEAVGWQTGYLVATVEDIIEANGIKTALLDVSFSAHMPDCLEMPYQPMIWGGDSEVISGKHVYRMGGQTCLAGDFVGYYSFDIELRPGDQLIIDDMIHYTMVKTTFFNGVKHPSIGIWSSDKNFKLLRSFSYSDYKNRLS